MNNLSDKTYFLVLFEEIVGNPNLRLFSTIEDIGVGIKYTVLSKKATRQDRELAIIAIKSYKEFK